MHCTHIEKKKKCPINIIAYFLGEKDKRTSNVKNYIVSYFSIINTPNVKDHLVI